MPEVGLVNVLGDFELSLPIEGVEGLALGYVLQVKSVSSPSDSPTFRGQTWESALQSVLGLRLGVPYGIWPANKHYM